MEKSFPEEKSLFKNLSAIMFLSKVMPKMNMQGFWGIQGTCKLKVKVLYFIRIVFKN
jgi:hypothetical protein